MTDITAVLRRQHIETPSWAYGNSGTRFKVFAQPGVPRDPFEKLADAARVHRFTGISGSPSCCWSRSLARRRSGEHMSVVGVR
jgi:L-rhamnose isomerase / sugar isomerase